MIKMLVTENIRKMCNLKDVRVNFVREAETRNQSEANKVMEVREDVYNKEDTDKCSTEYQHSADGHLTVYDSWLFVSAADFCCKKNNEATSGRECFLGFILGSANGTGAPQCTAALLPSKCISLQPVWQSRSSGTWQKLVLVPVARSVEHLQGWGSARKNLQNWTALSNQLRAKSLWNISNTFTPQRIQCVQEGEAKERGGKKRISSRVEKV